MGMLVDTGITTRFEDQRQQLEELRSIVERVGAKLRESCQLINELGQQKLLLKLERDAALAEVEELRHKLRSVVPGAGV